VILSDPSSKNCNDRLATVPLKTVSDQERIIYPCFY